MAKRRRRPRKPRRRIRRISGRSYRPDNVMSFPYESYYKHWKKHPRYKSSTNAPKNSAQKASNSQKSDTSNEWWFMKPWDPYNKGQSSETRSQSYQPRQTALQREIEQQQDPQNSQASSYWNYLGYAAYAAPAAGLAGALASRDPMAIATASANFLNAINRPAEAQSVTNAANRYQDWTNTAPYDLNQEPTWGNYASQRYNQFRDLIPTPNQQPGNPPPPQ